jgi:hypothetical protein
VKSDNDFKEFQKHPIAAFDPFYTRDWDNFRYAWDNYRKQVRELVNAAESLRKVNKLLGDFVDTVSKIHAYERATRNHILSFTDSSGRMRQNRSYLRMLDD